MNVETIWLEYRARLKAFLHSKVSNPADVDDLLQDISIKTFTGLSALEDQSKVQSWLFQTAHRTIIDFYRKNAHVKNIHPDDLWYAEDIPNALHGLEKCIEPFIAALPEETGQLLTAIDVQGQSQKNYATQHNIPYSTLKSRIQNARRALRSVFEECCHLTLDTRGNIYNYHSKTNSCDNC